MSRSLEAMLAYEASRRPEVAALVARAGELSDKEIEDAVVPLPWYRKALALVRAQARAVQIAQQLEASLPYDVSSHVAPIPGKAYRYTGEDIWVQLVKTTQAEAEIRGNTMVFIADDGRAWLGISVCDPIDPRISSKLLPLGEMTRDDYKRMMDAEQNRNCPANAPVIDMTGSTRAQSPASSRLSEFGITFR